MLKKLWSDQEGAVIILVAFAMVVLAGVTALTVDIGRAYAVRNSMENAMDAAALAGVVELPGDPEQAEAVAKTYATDNHISESELAIDIDNNNHDITVSSTRSVETLFARILGSDYDTLQISPSAKARCDNTSVVEGRDNLVPVGLQVIEGMPFEIGQEYILKEGGGGGSFGFFGWLYFEDGTTPVAAEDQLKVGYKGKVYVGEEVQAKNGNLGSHGKDGVDYRIAACSHIPSCTAGSYDPDCPRVIIVPIVSDDYNSGSNQKVTVLGFASMFLSGWEGSPGQGSVKATLINAKISGEGDSEAECYGTYSYQLIK